MSDQQPEHCGGEAADLSLRGLRIASIFIIMAASAIGAFSPIFLAKQRKIKTPKFTFFILKFIGTGVILATAWLHLLAPAAESLGDPCLEHRLGDYPWAFAIGLWTVLLMFFIEMLACRAVDGADSHHGPCSELDPHLDPAMEIIMAKNGNGGNLFRDEVAKNEHETEENLDLESGGSGSTAVSEQGQNGIITPEDHVMCRRESEEGPTHRHGHKHGDTHDDDTKSHNLAGQLLSIFILEFGVLFHSVFIGLTLGTTSDFIVLFIVLIFHQMFEGLGLGSRLAIAPWPKDKPWLPYLLALLFSLSTPVGVAVGVGAQMKNADTQTLVNGIFDSVSAGILMYTGFMELLAHEFMFNPYMRRAPLKILFLAFGCVLLGMAVMALLAKWA